MASTCSPTLKRAVPSVQVRLTSLFGMVRSVPNRLRTNNFRSYRCISNTLLLAAAPKSLIVFVIRK